MQSFHVFLLFLLKHWVSVCKLRCVFFFFFLILKNSLLVWDACSVGFKNCIITGVFYLRCKIQLCLPTKENLSSSCVRGIWFFGQNDGWTSVSVVIWYWKELATRLQLQNVFTKVVLLSIGFPLQSICAGCIQCHRCSSVPDLTWIWSVGHRLFRKHRSVLQAHKMQAQPEGRSQRKSKSLPAICTAGCAGVCV